MSRPRPEPELDPGQIDGEPAEVAEATRKLLANVAIEVELLAERSVRQIRNAVLTAALDADPSLGPNGLGEAWAQSPEARRAELLRRAAGLFAAAARGL